MNQPPSVRTILILSANPQGTGALRLDEEVREIKAGLQRSRYRDRFVLEHQSAARPRDVQRAMLDYKPQIVHFCGHGTGEQGLLMEDDAGRFRAVSTVALATLFELFSRQVECILLNACYSQVQAAAIAQHIPSVIGMNQPIGDRAAIEFATSFYDALGAGETVEFAFRLGKNAMQLAGIPEEMTPVLFKKSLVPQTAAAPPVRTPQPPPQQSRKAIVEPAVMGSPETGLQEIPVAIAQPTLPEIQNISPQPVPQHPATQPIEILQSDRFLYDAYISYVDQEPDASWVWDTLLPRLEQANLRIAVSGDSNNPGVARIVEMEQGIQQAKRTIIILSETYLADHGASFENILGQTLGIQEGTYRLLPVQYTAVDPKRLPIRLGMLSILDLSHPGRAERNFERLLQALQSPLPQM